MIFSALPHSHFFSENGSCLLGNGIMYVGIFFNPTGIINKQKQAGARFVLCDTGDMMSTLSP